MSNTDSCAISAVEQLETKYKIDHSRSWILLGGFSEQVIFNNLHKHTKVMPFFPENSLPTDLRTISLQIATSPFCNVSSSSGSRPISIQ